RRVPGRPGSEGAVFRAARRVPRPDRAFAIQRNNLSVIPKRHPDHAALVAAVGGDLMPRGEVPEPQGVVLAARGEQPLVRAESQAGKRPGPAENVPCTAGPHLPDSHGWVQDPHRLKTTAGGNPLPLRTEGGARESFVLVQRSLPERPDKVPRPGVPEFE